MNDVDEPVAPHPSQLPQELAALAASIATTVGEAVRSMRETGVTLAGTKSSLTDIVTAADQEAERRVVQLLTDARPDDGILGEEGSSRPGTTGLTWVIDPIDGTVNYLYDIPAYAVSIAVTVSDPNATADGRRAIAGAVYNPATRELFEAWEGGGARRNSVPIHISGHTDLATSLVATGFGYSVQRRTEQAEVVAKLIPQVRDIRRIGSCAYDLCLLAQGSLDAYYERGIQPWDYAAGALIARESGALVIGLDAATPPGEPLLVAASPALAPVLRDALNMQDARPEEPYPRQNCA